MSAGATPPSGRLPSGGMVMSQLNRSRLIGSTFPSGSDDAARVDRMSSVRATQVASRGGVLGFRWSSSNQRGRQGSGASGFGGDDLEVERVPELEYPAVAAIKSHLAFF